MTRRTRAPRRAGFTLVELLVVIGIIVLMVGLLLPAISSARESAKRTRATTEIRQVETAIGLYKSKFNITYLPAFGGGPNGTFRLCSSYVDPNGNPLPWPELLYLKQVFPQMGLSDNGLRLNGQPVANSAPELLDPNQTMVLFLTGNVYTAFQGFSNNKQYPFMPVQSQGETRIGPFMDFSLTKYQLGSNGFAANGGSGNAGSLIDPWNNPYAYFTSVQGNDYGGSFNWTNPAGVLTTVSPYYTQTGSLKKFQNQKQCQIISAGRNKLFGPGGGNWQTGGGTAYDPETGAGGDDLSNFNTGLLNKVTQ